jgi:transcription-repair coupling factor (superfamily II helicase)
MADGPVLKAQSAVARPECVVGAAATRIAEALAGRNVLAIISGDYRAQDIHAALLGAAPKAHAIFFPPSDALPGDTQPPTSANTGARLAALRRARGWAEEKSGRRIACITTAEAASEMLP